MVMENCCGPGPDTTNTIASAAVAFAEALGKVFGKKGDESEEKDPPLVTITKRETIYEFDAKAVVDAIIGGIAGIGKAFSSRGEPVSMPPLRQRHMPNDMTPWEQEDGKLRPDFVRSAIENTIDCGPKSEDEDTCLRRCVESIEDFVPEKHREQFREELAVIMAGRAEVQPKQAKKGPIVPPAPTTEAPKSEDQKAPTPSESIAQPPVGDMTPGGRRIVSVKTLSEEDLKRLGLPPDYEPRVEVTVNGSDEIPRSFRANTREEAVDKADIALGRIILVAHDEGKSENSIDYEGDLRDENPMSPKNV